MAFSLASQMGTAKPTGYSLVNTSEPAIGSYISPSNDSQPGNLQQLWQEYQNNADALSRTPTQTKLSDDDKRRAALDFGLGMLSNIGKANSNLASSIGTSGLAALQDLRSHRDSEQADQQKRLQARQSYLANALDYLNRRDQQGWERRQDTIGNALAREKLANGQAYNQQRLALARAKAASQAPVEAARANYYRAQARNAQRSGGGTETERYTRNLIARGMPSGWAEDAAHGNVRAKTDQFGNTRLVNTATGESRELGRPSARGQELGRGASTTSGPTSAQDSANQQNAQTSPDTSDNVFSEIEQGTGPIAGARSAVNSFIGPFVKGVPFERTAESRAGIRNFTQDAKTALVNNPRFPVAEQEVVQKLLPDADKFWTDPDAERAKLSKLRQFLQQKKGQNENSINGGRITEKEVGDLANQNAAIDRVLGLMGSPEDAGQQSGESLPSGIPQGSQKIGTLHGAPVYKTPDGRHLVAQ
ncbi:hypothetical protein [Salinisphaera hydrothermalis]|uniref:hypothetical protein n=1 Tax=Salinisphaera hydrothermalis TaxID=563188 RepID=UPI00333FD3C2